MQSVRITPLAIETYKEISGTFKQYLLDYLSLDSYYLVGDISFQNSVEQYYTELKSDTFRNDTWYMTRVVDYKLLHTINPVTGVYEAILPPDFVNYWQGYDKHILISPYIYNTSFMTAWNTYYISYKRYIRDDDPYIAIPTSFYDFLAIKIALRMNINSKFKTTQFDKKELQALLGEQKQIALRADVALFNTL